MSHPIFARLYDRRSVSEERRQAPYREELLTGLSGRVLEIGCGNGLNFAHYPPEVVELVAIEPEPYLRAAAVRAPTVVPKTSVSDATIEDYSADSTFDAIVFSLVLCSVRDPSAVLPKAKGLLASGGELRLYEHVRSENAHLCRVQDLCVPIWRLIAGGCHPNRDTESIVSSEFSVASVRRFDLRTGPLVPFGLVAPHVLIRAH